MNAKVDSMGVNGFIRRYWGKADAGYAGEPKWHPLAYHCLDVAACAAMLLERRPAWLAALGRQSGVDAKWLRPWLHFLAAIHDLGKFGDGFQAWRPDLLATLQGRSGIGAGGERHDTLGYVLAEKHLLDWLGRDGQDPDLFDLVQPWLSAVTGHHGRPAKNLNGAALLRQHFPRSVVEDSCAQSAQRRLSLSCRPARLLEAEGTSPGCVAPVRSQRSFLARHCGKPAGSMCWISPAIWEMGKLGMV